MIKDRIEALKIATIVINELDGSDCTNSAGIKYELRIIAQQLDKKADELIKKYDKASLLSNRTSTGTDPLGFPV